MTALLADKRVFSICDDLRKDDFVTSRGVLKAAKNGWIRTRDKDLAQEIKQREPWCILVEHEEEAANRAMRGQDMRSFSGAPWKEGKTTDAEFEADGWVRQGNGWIKKYGNNA